MKDEQEIKKKLNSAVNTLTKAMSEKGIFFQSVETSFRQDENTCYAEAIVCFKDTTLINSIVGAMFTVVRGEEPYRYMKISIVKGENEGVEKYTFKANEIYPRLKKKEEVNNDVSGASRRKTFFFIALLLLLVFSCGVVIVTQTQRLQQKNTIEKPNTDTSISLCPTNQTERQCK